MTDIERLLEISELDDAKIMQMDDSHLNSFTETANSFIDGYPAQEEKVKNALKAKDFDVLTESLAAVCDMLRQIYAEKLAEECSNRLETVDDAQYEDLQAFVINFLKTVSALSIDLQMIEYHDIPDTPKPSSDSAQGSAKRKTILAVDDLPFFLNTISTMLHNSGYKATCINSGKAALNYLKTNQPGLFLLDIDMPEMDGYELARRIRESGHTAPIIFLTGNARKDSVIKALQAGAVDFIVKPVTQTELLERIRKYI